MSNVFDTPDESTDEWADVRMTDPEAGEWDVDVVVVGGHVEYVDLRIKSSLLAGFVECLLEDVEHERAEEILQTVATRKGIDLDGENGDLEAGDE